MHTRRGLGVYIGRSLRPLSFPPAPSWKGREGSRGRDDASKRTASQRPTILPNISRCIECLRWRIIKYNFIAIPLKTNFRSRNSNPSEVGRRSSTLRREQPDLRQKMIGGDVIVCVHREIGISMPRIRSVCKQPLSLLLGRCQTGKRLAPVSNKKKKKKEEEERGRFLASSLLHFASLRSW